MSNSCEHCDGPAPEGWRFCSPKCKSEDIYGVPQIEDRYLGDGVYASWDGYHIVLDLRAQDSFTKIALDAAVLNALEQYRLEIIGPPLEDEDEGK